MIYLGDVSEKYQNISEVASFITNQASERQEICQCLFEKVELVAAPGDKPFRIKNYFNSKVAKSIGDSSD